MTSLKNIVSHQGGAAAVQYALVAGFMALATLAGSLILREPVIDLYTQMSSQASDALTGSSAAGPLEEG